MSGVDLICTSTNYSSLNISGATYDWSGNNVTISGSGSSISATKISDGTGWLQTQISSLYSGTTITSEKKSFTLGTPTPSIAAEQISGSGEPTTVEFTADPIVGSTYNWYVDNLLKESEAYPNNIFSWYFPANVTKTIKCNENNICGTSGYSNSISVTGEYKWGHNYSIYPNPAISELTISQIESKESNSTKEQTQPIQIKSIKIIDNYGITNMVKKFGNETMKTTINISNLPIGSYLIIINEGTEAESYSFLKN